MQPLTIADIAVATGAEMKGGPPPAGAVTISTDSRTVAPGQVFVALQGPNFDGHQFVGEACRRGAVAAVVARVPEQVPAGCCLLLVTDTLRALGAVAAAYRRGFGGPVVAVTGSTGKTTTKELTHAILAKGGPVLKTAENYNNEVGVPLTLLGLAEEHRAAVVELGMRGPGEIGYLAELVQPTVAVITNIGRAHLGRLGTVEAIAEAKGEILEHVAAEGTAVLNADDEHYERLRRRACGRVLSFGLGGGADVHAEQVYFRDNLYAEFMLCSPQGKVQVAMALPGRHNLTNGLAAAAAALAAGSPLEQVAAGLGEALTLDNRLRLRPAPSGAVVVDDCYNASPASMEVALELLQGMPATVRVAVLGDMKELGPEQEALHREIGRLVAASGVNRLVAFGPLARHYVEGAGRLPGGTYWTEDREQAAELAAQGLRAGTAILVKGSRAMEMEHIVERLLGE